MYREQYPFSLNKLYQSVGISKQAVSTMINRLLKKKDEQMQLVRCIYDIRQDHPTMGVRDIYYKMLPNCMGRDAFERFCKEQNLMSKSPKNYRRTTDSSGVIRFDNLIENIVSTAINQVWQSDISYFEVGGKFYYLTFILDAFSRRIIGHATSERLFTEQTTLPALDMAIRNRKINNPLRGLIFHSDGGGQYYDKEFLKVTQKHGIQNSMCEFAWENGKAERINGIIKNNYLKHRNINSYEQLVKEVDRSVSLYNHDKPHIKLKRLSPIAFENKILHLSSSFKESRSINKYNYAEHS